MLFSDIWSYLKDKLEIEFPDFVINLLKINCYDNKMALTNFSHEDIVSIEDFAKNILPNLIDTENEDELKKYYGFFFKSYKNFCMPAGVKKTLLKIGNELGRIEKCNEESGGTSLFEQSSENNSISSAIPPTQKKRKIAPKGCEKQGEKLDQIVKNFNINTARKELEHILRKYIKALPTLDRTKLGCEDHNMELNLKVALSTRIDDENQNENADLKSSSIVIATGIKYFSIPIHYFKYS